MIPLEQITLIMKLLDEIHDDIQGGLDDTLLHKYGIRLNDAKHILSIEKAELTPGTKFWACIADIAGHPIVFWDTYKRIYRRINKIDPAILDGIAVKDKEIIPREMRINHVCGRLMVYDQVLSKLLNQVFHSEPDCK